MVQNFEISYEVLGLVTWIYGFMDEGDKWKDVNTGKYPWKLRRILTTLGCRVYVVKDLKIFSSAF